MLTCASQVKPSPSAKCWSWLRSATEGPAGCPTESWWREGSGRTLTRPLRLSAATAPSRLDPLFCVPEISFRIWKHTHNKRKKVFKADDKPRWSPHESSFLILRAQLCCFWVSPPSTNHSGLTSPIHDSFLSLSFGFLLSSMTMTEVISVNRCGQKSIAGNIKWFSEVNL